MDLWLIPVQYHQHWLTLNQPAALASSAFQLARQGLVKTGGEAVLDIVMERCSDASMWW